MNTAMVLAQNAIGSILDGAGPNGTDPGQMGTFAECYEEMTAAYTHGGADAARRVFAIYAKSNAQLAALRSGDISLSATVWSTEKLLSTDFPPPKWLVPNLVPVGLTILAGRPKLGKSWLALQIAVAVGNSGLVLGQTVERDRVLYLALEDNPRRLQDRLRKLNALATTQIDFRFDWGPLIKHGTSDLLEVISARGYRLVIIDTISRALGHADQMNQTDMTEVLGKLQRIASEKEIAILLVDHHRKMGTSDGDVIDDVMGATSKAAVADAAIGLYRKRGEKTATLKVSGRDVDDQELSLEWDTQLFIWHLVGDAAGVRTNSVQAEILVGIKEMGGKATAAAIARWLDKKPGNITRELQELVAKHMLVRTQQKGREVPYSLPTEPQFDSCGIGDTNHDVTC